MRHPTRFLVTGLLAACLAAGAVPTPEDPPKAAASGTSAIPFFLDIPADREAFWNRLLRPDFVVVDGEEFRGLRDRGGDARATGQTRPPIILSVAASGRVDDDRARLSIAFVAAVERDGSCWATIRLDGLTIARASEGGRDLPTRVGDDRAWQVELDGRGEHRVSVEVLAPIRGGAEARRLELPIPPAASTRIDLDVPRDILSASTAPNEPVAVARPDGAAAPSCRLSARLSPRASLELTWRERANPGVLLPILLSTHAEIALEFERGFLRTRSTWIVSAVRGTVDRVSFRAAATDEVLDVEVDDEPVAFEGRAEAGKSVITVPLDDPLRPDRPIRLLVTTRRSVPSGGPARVAFHGFPFDEAKVQTGVLAIARSGPVYPVPAPGRGLRRIDARAELPEGLRTRPDTLMAFEFTSQPFELTFQVEPEPPLIRFESRTTVAISPRTAIVDARLDGRIIQGRPFETSVTISEGLDLESVGPPGVVESSRAATDGPAPAPGTKPADVARVLTIVLSRAARDAGSFQLLLKGRCDVDPSRPVEIPLFVPRDASTIGGSLVVLGGRELAIEPGEEAGGRPSPFRVEWGATPPGWEWPSGRAPGPGTSTLWFRQDSGARALPLRVTDRPLSLRHESVATVTIDRKGADVVDEVDAAVAFGAISGLDVTMPPEVPARWDVEGVELAGRDLLGREPDGSRRYRLRFAREQADAFRLRFRYRLPFAGPIGFGREATLRFAPTRVEEGASTGRQVRLLSEPGLAIEATAPGWTPAPLDALPAGEAGPVLRRVLGRGDEDAHEPVAVVARAEPTVPLPTLIASRAWIRTLQRPEGDLETTAWYRIESRDGAVSVALPPGSRWIRARIGGGEASGGDVEVAGPDHYRVRFPAGSTPGPSLVGFEYVVPAASGALIPPRLMGEALVQQTCWEVQVIGTRVGVGVPAGWTDENEWYRDGVIWKRRPWKSPGEMAAWVAGSNAPEAIPNDLAAGATFGRHGYMFSRAGSPAPLPFRIESRFVLVALCSGPLLAIGLLILARRPPPRPWIGGGLVLAFLAGTFGEISVVLLVIQSASLGVALMLAALGMQWLLARRGSLPRRGDAARVVVGSSPGRTSLAGSDESTAIRRPPLPGAASTADHPGMDAASVTMKTPIAPSTASLGPQ